MRSNFVAKRPLGKRHNRHESISFNFFFGFVTCFLAIKKCFKASRFRKYPERSVFIYCYDTEQYIGEANLIEHKCYLVMFERNEMATNDRSRFYFSRLLLFVYIAWGLIRVARRSCDTGFATYSTLCSKRAESWNQFWRLLFS